MERLYVKPYIEIIELNGDNVFMDAISVKKPNSANTEELEELTDKSYNAGWVDMQ